jgi:hypothetical protein
MDTKWFRIKHFRNIRVGGVKVQMPRLIVAKYVCRKIDRDNPTGQ